MSIIGRRSREKSLTLDKSAWFLCRFLCRALSEDNFDKVRDHVSTCKGAKTRLRLSEKGVEIGYKPGHVRHFHHKVKYELIPLEVTESMIQDTMFINVLLCVFHVQNLPDIEYEIIAFKFPDSNTVKRYQDVCNILVGGLAQARYGAPGKSGNLTLMPAKSYHMGTLSPEKWVSPDRTGAGSVSEISYNRGGPRGASGGYGTIIPASEVQRKGMGQMEGDDVSLASSAGQTFREVAVSAKLDQTGSTSTDRSKTAANNDKYPNYLRAESGSIVTEEDVEDGRTLRGDGVLLSYSNHRPRNNNVAVTSMDVIDNGSLLGGQSEYQQSTSKRFFKRSQNDSKGHIVESPSGPQFNGRVIPSSRSDIYRPSADTMSVRSQGSYYLVPSFKKVYAPRSGRAMSPGYHDGSLYQDNRSRIYAGSEMRLNGNRY